MAFTWDDIFRQQGVQIPQQPIPGTGRVDTFADIYGTGGSNPVQGVPAPTPTPTPAPTAQNLPANWWTNPFYSNVPGWGRSPGDDNAAFWDPSRYQDSQSRAAAWNALGQPSVDYLGRSVTAQDGGGVISWGGQKIAPNTNNGFAQVFQPTSSGQMAPSAPPVTAPATTTTTPNTTTNTTQTTPGSGTTNSAGLGTQNATGVANPQQQSTQNKTPGQTVLGGQLNADLSVSNPRRRVANAMVVRR